MFLWIVRRSPLVQVVFELEKIKLKCAEFTPISLFWEVWFTSWVKEYQEWINTAHKEEATLFHFNNNDSIVLEFKYLFFVVLYHLSNYNGLGELSYFYFAITQNPMFLVCWSKTSVFHRLEGLWISSCLTGLVVAHKMLGEEKKLDETTNNSKNQELFFMMF